MHDRLLVRPRSLSEPNEVKTVNVVGGGRSSPKIHVFWSILEMREKTIAGETHYEAYGLSRAHRLLCLRPVDFRRPSSTI